MTVRVLHLMHRDGLGQREHTPVGDPADHAAIAQHQAADCVCDSVERSRLGFGFDTSYVVRKESGTYSRTSDRLPGRTWRDSMVSS